MPEGYLLLPTRPVSDTVMAFDAFKDDSESDDSGNDTEKAGGTHLYFGQEGYDKLPKSVTHSDEAMERVEKAYELSRTSPNGKVRQFANDYIEGGLHRLLADFAITYGKVIDAAGDPTPFMTDMIGDFSEEDQAAAIINHLEENPEVGALIEERLSGNSEDGEGE